MPAPAIAIAITASASITFVRMPSLRSTSPIHARRPSSPIGPKLVEKRVGSSLDYAPHEPLHTPESKENTECPMQ